MRLLSVPEAMKAFLSTMLVCLAVHLATAEPQCDLGKQIVDKVDNKITDGIWKTKYVKPKNFSDEVGRCWMDIYTPISNGKSYKLASYTSPKNGEIIKSIASVQLVENRNMKMTFLNSTPEFSGFSGIYHILAWDEDEGYYIAGGCPTVLKNEPVVWIAYRQYPPSEDSLEASKAALKKTGLKLEDFHEHCE
ncbi:uncharacterized protein [Periplaneta americana]|uniref:uncharacterized protein n=1 Tax=Periplaneta americana TaxID=6978 RepID=UPI0037E96890